jgi:hypothetical protein
MCHGAFICGSLAAGWGFTSKRTTLRKAGFVAEQEERDGAEWANQTDAHLVGYAGRPFETPQAPAVEMQRRLKEAIKDFNKKSGRQATWMIWLTVAIVVLTVFIAVLTAVLVGREL